jgi:hypothetical protein
MEGRTILAFAGCNYLGLANDPRVLQAVRIGLDRYGLSTTASRETTGNTTAFDDLERSLANFLCMERSLLLADGYTANIAMAQALATRFRTVLIDAKSHHSVHDAARGAGLIVVTFPHGDTHAAARLARMHAEADPAGAIAILTDGVFTSDGAVAKLPELIAALPNDRSLLVVDDCHGVCVLGPEGRGTVSHYALTDPRIIITTTLAKGFRLLRRVHRGTDLVHRTGAGSVRDLSLLDTDSARDRDGGTGGAPDRACRAGAARPSPFERRETARAAAGDGAADPRRWPGDPNLRVPARHTGAHGERPPLDAG